jgi:hypothetical protein
MREHVKNDASERHYQKQSSLVVIKRIGKGIWYYIKESCPPLTPSI